MGIMRIKNNVNNFRPSKSHPVESISTSEQIDSERMFDTYVRLLFI